MKYFVYVCRNTQYTMHSDLYTRLSDEELFGLIRTNDAIAYEEIYERYFYVLYVHAYKKLQSKEEAQDIIHEVFYILWNKRKTLLLTSNVAGYLYTSVRNRIFNFLAREKLQHQYVESIREFSVSTRDSTDHRIREGDLRAAIQREVDALPPKMRQVFELSRVHHLNHKEIAERMQISDKTVKRQISNALRLLKTKLGLLILIFIYF